MRNNTPQARGVPGFGLGLEEQAAAVFAMSGKLCSAQMTLKQLFSVLLARKRTALSVLAVIVLVVAGYSLLQPKQYAASAALMIDVRSADPLAAANSAAYGSSSSAYIATQVDVIQSERVALRALRAANLNNDPNWRKLWADATGERGEFEPWLSEQLLKKLDVRPSRESSVVNIGYSATDPAFAARMANAFVKAYIDTALDLKVEPARQYNTFFDESSKRLRAALEQAQQRLSAYQQAKGIIATDDRLDVETARLQELSSQVVSLQGVAAESAGRQGQAGANSPEVLSNPAIAILTGELSRQEGRLYELRQRLGERNPQVIELSASVEQQRGRLNSETRRIASSIGLTNNVDRSRLAAATGALNAQRAKVLGLRSQRDEASVLQRDMDNAQKAYDASLSRLTQTGLESQNTQTNISVLKTASVPPVASSPRVLLNIAVALVVGALVAVCIVVCLEYVDRRLRSPSDVTQLLGQALLITIPRGSRALVEHSVAMQGRKSHLVNTLPQSNA